MAKTPKYESTKRIIGPYRYYRRFVKDYGSISRPLIVLLKRDQFKWIGVADITFHNLKNAMNVSLALALPDFSQPFIIEIDAFRISIGVVLMQKGFPWLILAKPYHQSTKPY